MKLYINIALRAVLLTAITSTTLANTTSLVTYPSTINGYITDCIINTYNDDTQTYTPIIYNNTGNISINSNQVQQIMRAGDAPITFENNDDINIINNNINQGAFFSNGVINFQGNQNITIAGNTGNGTIFTGSQGVYFNHNGDIAVKENSNNYNIFHAYDDIELKNNGNITVSNNGLATNIIYSWTGNVDISDNQKVHFTRNTTESTYQPWGPFAVIESSASVIINNNTEILFEGQSIIAGSAEDTTGINAKSLKIEKNGLVAFKDNKMSGSYGSTLFVIEENVDISQNTNVEITSNDGTNSDGNINHLMIVGESLNLSSNDTLKIENNAGKIAGKNVNITNNGSVTFSGNRMNSTFNAHIDTEQGDLNITGNDQVVFEKNYVRNSDEDFRVGTYLEAWAGSANLSAKEGGSIKFNDRAYITASHNINLNSDYVDAEGKTQKATGDIVFTGKHAESNINDLLASHNLERKASNDELNYARTSDLHCTNATLQGGTLRVEDKAVVNININGGSGLSVTDGSHATVKIDNAELNMGDSNRKYAINIGNTGTLTMANEAKLMASTLDIATGATLAAVGSSGVSALSSTMYNTAVAGNIVANLTLEAGSTLVADGASFTMGDNCVLTFEAVTGKELINLGLSFGVAYTADDQVLLFSGVDSVQFMVDGEALTDTSVQASKFFTGEWVNENTILNYDSATQAVYVQNVNYVIPEPATATLSLLALAGLAARRRRK